MKETQQTNPEKKTLKTPRKISKYFRLSDQMDQKEQRSVVVFLRVQGLSKTMTHHELVEVLQENAVLYSNVTRFCKEAILGLNSEQARSSPKDDRLDEVNEAILLTLSDESFSSVPSVRQTARRICVPNSTR
jgi:hypothetical protein